MWSDNKHASSEANFFNSSAKKECFEWRIAISTFELCFPIVKLVNSSENSACIVIGSKFVNCGSFDAYSILKFPTKQLFRKNMQTVHILYARMSKIWHSLYIHSIFLPFVHFFYAHTVEILPQNMHQCTKFIDCELNLISFKFSHFVPKI